MSTELQKQVARLHAGNQFIGAVSGDLHRFASIFLSTKDAAAVDVETVYDAAVSGLLELRQYDERFEYYLENLLHPSSIALQRELKTSEHLSIFANEPSAHRIFEYLVRRYRVHDHNVESFLKCVLSIHDTKIFARIVQLSTISGTHWSFLEGIKKSASPMLRSLLAKRCRKDVTLVETLCSMQNSALKLLTREHDSSSDHRVCKGVNRVLSFVTATLMECFEDNAISDAHLRQLLTTLMDGLRVKTVTEGVFINPQHPLHQWRRSSCMIVIQIARRTALAQPLLQSLLKELTRAMLDVTATVTETAEDSHTISMAAELLSTMSLLAQLQDSDEITAALSAGTGFMVATALLVGWKHFGTVLAVSSETTDPSKLLTCLFHAGSSLLLHSNGSDELLPKLREMVHSDVLGDAALAAYVTRALRHLCLSMSTPPASNITLKASIELLRAISQRRAELFDGCIRTAVSEAHEQEQVQGEAGAVHSVTATAIREVLAAVFSTALCVNSNTTEKGQSTTKQEQEQQHSVQLLLALNHPSKDLRIRALDMFADADVSQISQEDSAGLAHAAVTNLGDTDVDVLRAAWSPRVLTAAARLLSASLNSDYDSEVTLSVYCGAIVAAWQQWEASGSRSEASRQRSCEAFEVMLGGLAGALSVSDAVVRAFAGQPTFRRWLALRAFLAISSECDSIAITASHNSTRILGYHLALALGDSGVVEGFKGLKRAKKGDGDSQWLSEQFVSCLVTNSVSSHGSALEDVLGAVAEFAHRRITDNNNNCDGASANANVVMTTVANSINVFASVANGLLLQPSTSSKSTLLRVCRLWVPLSVSFIGLMSDNYSEIEAPSSTQQTRMIDQCRSHVSALIAIFANHRDVFRCVNSNGNTSNTITDTDAKGLCLDASSVLSYYNSAVVSLSAEDLPARLLCGLLASQIPPFVELAGRCLVATSASSNTDDTIPNSVTHTLLRLLVASIAQQEHEQGRVQLCHPGDAIPNTATITNTAAFTGQLLVPVGSAVGAVYTLAAYLDASLRSPDHRSQSKTQSLSLSLLSLMPVLVTLCGSRHAAVRSAAVSLADTLSQLPASKPLSFSLSRSHSKSDKTHKSKGNSNNNSKSSYSEDGLKELWGLLPLLHSATTTDVGSDFDILPPVVALAASLATRATSIVMDLQAASSAAGAFAYTNSESDEAVSFRWLLWSACAFRLAISANTNGATPVSQASAGVVRMLAAVFTAAAVSQSASQYCWPFVRHCCSADVVQYADSDNSVSERTWSQYATSLIQCLASCANNNSDNNLVPQLDVAHLIARCLAAATENSCCEFAEALAASLRLALSRGLAVTWQSESARAVLFSALLDHLSNSNSNSLTVSSAGSGEAAAAMEAVVRTPVPLTVVRSYVNTAVSEFTDAVQSSNAKVDEAMAVVRSDNAMDLDDAVYNSTEGIAVCSLTQPLLRLTTVIEAITAVLSSAVNSTNSVNNSDTEKEYGSMAASLSDAFAAINRSAFSVILNVEYSKVVALDLLTHCASLSLSTLHNTDTTRVLPDIAQSQSEVKASGKKKAGKDMSSSSNVYTSGRVAADIQAVLACMAAAKSDQLQLSSVNFLKCALRSTSAHLPLCVEALGRLVAQAASVGYSTNSNGNSTGASASFIAKVLRLIADISESNVASPSSAKQIQKVTTSPTSLTQDILQPLCKHFPRMNNARRYELSELALTTLGAHNALPAYVNTVLALAIHAYKSPSPSTDSDAALTLDDSSGNEDKGEHFVILSRAAQRKAHRTALVSVPEELYRMAIDLTVNSTTQVVQTAAVLQAGNLVVQLKCAQRLLSGAFRHFSRVGSGSGLDGVNNSEEDELRVDLSAYNNVNNVSDSNQSLTLSVHSIHQFARSLTDTFHDDDSSLSNHSHSAALAILAIEYVKDVLENRAFHRNMIPVSTSSQESVELQRLFLELSEQLLELLSFAGHWQVTNTSSSSKNSSKSKPKESSKFLIPVTLGGSTVTLTVAGLCKLLVSQSLDMLESLQRILDAPTFVQILEELLGHDSIGVRNKALQILAKRLEHMSKMKDQDRELALFLDLTIKLRASVLDIGNSVSRSSVQSYFVYEDPKISHCQSSLLCLDAVARYLAVNLKGRSQSQSHSQWTDSMCTALSELVQLGRTIAAVVNVTVNVNGNEKSKMQDQSESTKKKKRSDPDTQGITSAIQHSASYAGLCKLLGSVYLCCGTLCSVVGPLSLPSLPTLFDAMLSSLDDCRACQTGVTGFTKGLSEGPTSTNVNVNLQKAQVLLMRSAVSAAAAVMKEVPNFCHPYIRRVLANVLPLYDIGIGNAHSHSMIQQADREALNGDIDVCLRTLYVRLPHRTVVPAVVDAADAQLSASPNVPASQKKRFVQFLSDLWSQYDRTAIAAHIGSLCALVALTLDHRRVYTAANSDADSSDNSDVDDIDAAAVAGAVEFCVKLTEGELKAFLVRLNEWKDVVVTTSSAVSPSSLTVSQSNYSRGVVFYQLVASLSNKLMGLFQPCVASLWPNAVDSLKQFASLNVDSLPSNHNTEAELNRDSKGKGSKKRSLPVVSDSAEGDKWRVVTEVRLRSEFLLQFVKTSCLHLSNSNLGDASAGRAQSSFLDDARFDSMMSAVVSVLSVEKLFKSDRDFLAFAESFAIPALVSLATAAGNDLQWKPMNRKLLALTREKKSVVRLSALKAIHRLFTEVGEEYLLLLPECLPYFSELLEDDMQEIAVLTGNLVRYIEEISGESLDSYLQ